MKKLLFSLLLAGCTFPAIAQPSGTARVDTGSLSGAFYRIDLPANWNRKLIMYAHGYEVIGSPSGTRLASASGGVGPYLQRGYAVAQSAYRRQGWAVGEGVEDTELLRQHFIQKYGKPDTTFMTGHSMGGMITLATIEKYPQHYQGALPMCPLSGRLHESLKAHLFDMLVTFDALFPNTLPALDQLALGSVPPVAPAIIVRRVQSDTALARRFAERYALHPGDLANVIWFFQEIFRDISQQAGGNPFDNTNTVYNGFPDDVALNRRVLRLSEKVEARHFLEKDGSFTGQLSRPMLLMHTTYDQLIPAAQATAYDAIVRRAGNERFFVTRFTTGSGHCAFTPAQTGAALDALREWISTGKKPAPGEIR
ncbi:MAG: DUF6351 family protein [Cytophagaceae bacterium]|nr:DUF6351 family protein [Cytophagaceae bacterium]